MNNAQEFSMELPSEINSDLGIVQYVSGVSEGKDYWAYVVMKPTRYMEYYTLVSQGQQIDLEEFGEILEEGVGKEPPQALQNRMMNDYNTDPEFKDMLEALGNKIIALSEENE